MCQIRLVSSLGIMSANPIDAQTLQKACDEYLKESEHSIVRNQPAGTCRMRLHGLSWPASPFSSALGYRSVGNKLWNMGTTEQQGLQKLKEFYDSEGVKPEVKINYVLSYVQGGADAITNELRGVWAGCYYEEEKNVWWVNPCRLHGIVNLTNAALSKVFHEKLANITNDIYDRSNITTVLDKYGIRKGMWVAVQKKEFNLLY